MKRRDVKMTTSVSGDCPFCAGRWEMGYSDKGIPMGVHSMPICTVWDSLDLTEFMVRVRRWGMN